jgi:peptidyl-prolyl cis-trans isomerase SurA
VAVVADEPITVSEFKSAYEKANVQTTPADDSLPAYDDFLEQYVNYRLKVRAAREAGLDTLAEVEREIAKYRKQLAKPRILETHIYEPLIRTLYERRQSEVDVSHILVRVKPDAAPEDTLEAYRKMQTIADSVAQGVPFAELAYRNSEDPSAQKKGQQGYRGRLGYLRAGQLVPPFEKRMYDVSPDSVSDVFRTRFGYHILKVHDRRPTKPPIRLSHVMLRPDSAGTPTRLLDSLRTAILQDSTTFEAVARQYSEDRRSAAKGGDLGTVSSPSALPPSFRDAVAALDSVGAVSDIVQTKYGYHLIKLTDREEPRSYEEAYDDLKKNISGSDRVERRRQSFARKVRTEAGVQVDTSALLSATSLASLDTLSRPLLSFANADTTDAPQTRIAALGDSTYTLGQLAHHVTQTDGGARMSVGDVLDDFLNAKAFTYAQARLEDRDPAFAAKMNEYRDGLLAFQFMQDSVWTTAARDTAALRRTFEKHRDRYRYPDRVRTIVLRAPADSLLLSYADSSDRNRSIPALVDAASTDSLLSVDTLMVTDQSSAVYKQVQSKPDGSVTGPIQHDGESILLLRDTLLPARRKQFEEALSGVTQDYQESYEEIVLRRLRKRYNVTTYPDRLQQAVQSDQ